MSTTKSQRLKISDQVKQALIRDILEGVLNPGDKLAPEDQIAQQFRVSKVTVREALCSLESQGFIEKRRGLFGGSYVAQPSLITMAQALSTSYRFGAFSPQEMIVFRKIVEPGFAALAAVNRTEEDLKKLEHHLSEVEKFLSLGRNPTKRKLEFHSLIAHACHNKLISAVSDALLDVFKEIPVEFSLDQDHKHLQSNKKIYSYICNHNPEGARKSMITHLKVLAEIIEKNKKKNVKGLRKK